MAIQGTEQEKQPSRSDYLLAEAKNHIVSLREQNRLMGARLDTFDSMMSVFNNRPQSRDGYGLVSSDFDIVGKIDMYFRYPESEGRKEDVAKEAPQTTAPASAAKSGTSKRNSKK